MGQVVRGMEGAMKAMDLEKVRLYCSYNISFDCAARLLLTKHTLRSQP